MSKKKQQPKANKWQLLAGLSKEVRLQAVAVLLRKIDVTISALTGSHPDQRLFKKKQQHPKKFRPVGNV